MAYSFYKREKRPDRETMYIAYMMISSLFKKTVVVNHVAEQQLYLYYCEMNPQTQEKIERSVLQHVEQILKGKLGYIGEMQAEVHFRLGEEHSYLIFSTGMDTIRAEISRKGELSIDSAFGDALCEPVAKEPAV